MNSSGPCDNDDDDDDNDDDDDDDGDDDEGIRSKLILKLLFQSTAAHWVIQFSLSYSLDRRHWSEHKENSVARVSQFLNSIHVLFLGGVKLPRTISACSPGLCQSYLLNHLIDR